MALNYMDQNEFNGNLEKYNNLLNRMQFIKIITWIYILLKIFLTKITIR